MVSTLASFKMIALLVFGLLSVATCAPYSPYGVHYPGSYFYRPGQDPRLNFGYRYGLGDINSLQRVQWPLPREDPLKNMLSSLQLKYPVTASSASVIGDQYKYVTLLPGFSEEEISVKPAPGNVIVTAEHISPDGISRKTYKDVIPLPANINSKKGGTWTYNGQLLTVTVSLLEQEPETEAVEKKDTVMTTPGSREVEEVAAKESKYEEDADVGSGKYSDEDVEKAIEELFGERK